MRKIFLGVVVLVLLAFTSSAALASDFRDLCRSGTPKQIQAALDRGEIVTDSAFRFTMYYNRYPQSWNILLREGKEYDLDLANLDVLEIGGGKTTPLIVLLKDEDAHGAKRWQGGKMLEFVSVLLNAGANPNKSIYEAFEKYPTTPLRLAITKVDRWPSDAISVVQALLNAGARPIDGDIAAARNIKNPQDRNAVLKMFNVSPTENQPSEVKNFKANGSITGNKVNVRTSPSLSSKVVKQLNAGHPIFISEQNGDWYRVQTASGTTGWVFGDYVKREGGSSKSEKEDYGKIPVEF